MVDDDEPFRPSPSDLEIFEAARALNPKTYSSNGRGTSFTKCATTDCTLRACGDSIFCMFCDNERHRPIYSSGSPSEEMHRLRKAQVDAKKGITKAVIL